MKNKEKYFDEILKIFNKYHYSETCEFRKRHVLKGKNCNDINCDECKMNFKAWLEQEYQEPIKLTDDEIVILKNIPKDYKWIARSSYKDLLIFSAKPEKDYSLGSWVNYGMYKDLDIYDHLFQFIKWEEDEPYNIDELLKQNGVER